MKSDHRNGGGGVAVRFFRDLPESREKGIAIRITCRDIAFLGGLRSPLKRR